MRNAPQPPIEYLASASQTSLEAFELARLNQVARLRTEILQTLEELVAAEVEARLAQRLSTHPSLHDVLLLSPPAPPRHPSRPRTRSQFLFAVPLPFRLHPPFPLRGQLSLRVPPLSRFIPLAQVLHT